jgi:hypothetical protein
LMAGVDAPADHIIATVVGVLTFLALPMWTTFCHRFSKPQLRQLCLLCFLASSAATAYFTRPGWEPFDALHPKRVLSLHNEDISTDPPQFSLHIAGVDRAPGFGGMVAQALKPLEVDTSALQVIKMNDSIPVSLLSP